jgi:hypothetical protein
MIRTFIPGGEVSNSPPLPGAHALSAAFVTLPLYARESVGALGIVRPLRPRCAVCLSPQREARGAFGLRRDGIRH